MLVKVFGYPTENGSFQNEFLFQTNRIISYEYTKKWVGTGQFTLVLAADKSYINRLVENCILNVNGDWLFVNNVKHSDKEITLSGTDLNGWLDLRVTTWGETQVAGAEGYDVIKGTTGECVNHYINNNAINPIDKNRKLPRLVIGQTAQGKEKDSYMARMQVLTEVIGNLCQNASIGYDITADVSENKFIFRTIVGTDRSAEQTTNTAVIFSQSRNNLFSAEYERGNEDLLNVIYATGADVTQVVYRNNTVSTGVLRRETAIDVSVDTVADIKDYALNQTSGNILNNSYELDIRGVEDYQKKYYLGDYVTVKDTTSNKNWTAQIVEVTTQVSSNAYKIRLTLGDAKTKLLNKIQNTVTINSISESNKTYNSTKGTVADATKLITGANGGYLLIHQNNDGIPYEILIMDTPDINTAVNLWRFNSSGLGHSSNGYNGPFPLAMTMDGQIVADRITAGTLNADIIKAGTLQGVKIIATTGSIAGWTMQNGVLVSNDGSMKLNSINNTLTVSDDAGNALMTINKSGVRFWRNGREIGKIGVTGNSEGTAYGLTFDLVDGDAMTWSVYDSESGKYVNKVRYTEKNGFVVHNNLSCDNFNGCELVKGTYTTADGQTINYWGWK